MRPYLSIIIPYYNAPEKLERLLLSLEKSKHAPPFEVIVVDDGSSVPATLGGWRGQEGLRRPGSPLRVAAEESPRQDPSRVLRILRLSRNHGPAVARNRGVAVARGEFVVFLDGDVEVFPDTLYEIARVYRDDPDVVALTGVWVKEQKSRRFFPNYKALRDWSYWINERDKSGYYFLFSTRIASIKKTVFTRLGGFDETYPAPLVEDIELTYRIARRYAIIFAPTVRVRHEFEGFWPIAKKYFLRAYYWTKLYERRKRFDPVATTLAEAITTLSGVGILVFGGMSIVALGSTLGTFTMPVLIVIGGFWVVLLVHMFCTKTFLAFAYREKGMGFMLKSFTTGLILCCFIFAGAVAGRMVHGRT